MTRGSLFSWRSQGEIARDVDSELAFHLEMRIAELQRNGLDTEAARRQATDEFGDIEFTRKYCASVDTSADREIRFSDRVASWQQDVGYALRMLRRSPAFTLISLVTLTLAIGANSAIFSVTHAVLLKPLPFPNPAQLVMMGENWPGRPGEGTPLSPPNYADYRAAQHSFVDIAAMLWGRPATWRVADGEPSNATELAVTANFFSVLQSKPMLGRTFLPGDDTPGHDAKVVLSHAFWQRAFGGDPNVIGRQIIVAGHPNEVVGVMPLGFTFGYNEDFWAPMDLTDDLTRAETTRKQHYIRAVGRLKDGVSIDAALADLTTTAHRLAEQYPAADSGRFATLQPLHEVISGKQRPALLLLLAGAGMVLLIACANLANLTLSRTTTRRREMAVRAALGAGRGRLVRQLIIESLMLALVGGALGIAFASIATGTLLALNHDALPSMTPVKVDATVVLFSVLLSLVTGVLFGIIPAIDASRTDLNSSLRDGGRGSSAGKGGSATRRAMVVAQIGLAVVLLVGAGLMVRSFAQLNRVRLGFNPSHVMTAMLRAAGERYDSAAPVNRLFDGVVTGLANTPGVVAVGGATLLPTQGRIGTSARIVGQLNDEANLPDLGYVSIRGDYFKAMGITLKAGREYTPFDADGAPKVAILNESAATKLFPHGDALNREIRIGPNPNGQPLRNVGIVADLRDESIDRPTQPTLYANHRQEAWDHTVSIVVRTTGDPTSVVGVLRRLVKEGDPSLSLRDIKTMDDLVGSSLSTRRFALGLIVSFAALALLLAAVGIYGVLAYMVTSRTREFGVRLALGASPASILRMVVGQGVGWSLVGLGAGIAAAMAGGKLLASSLYNVPAVDPVTYVGVAAGLMAIVVSACIIPAVRATRVDPIASMRTE